jgi:hypothetical protein
MMFLTQEEIREATGLEQPSAQERLLRSWGLTVFRNRANKVMLAREAYVRWQLGERPERIQKTPQVKLFSKAA